MISRLLRYSATFCWKAAFLVIGDTASPSQLQAVSVEAGGNRHQMDGTTDQRPHQAA
jgi:hypothetical protein